MQLQPSFVVELLCPADQRHHALHAALHMDGHAKTLIHAEVARFLHHPAGRQVGLAVIGRVGPVKRSCGGKAVPRHRVEMHIA
ncbi:hypothetical protein FQZ97_1136410 [compost metagenome]